ncbi:hypothetical protein Q8F55_005149 [Vanrija albida]|uniref:Major facilitator superfamily (MFS) profile domain-containing protein n=1 Tax=Vanrija albida TaxID=181172 RepID=A0ABR3Q0U6_9TREE
MSSDKIDKIEKYGVETVDDIHTVEDREFLESFSEERKKSLYRKIDWRLVPMLSLLYLFAYLDRANIGNAKIEGMPKYLHLSDQQYNIVLSIFFVPYIIFEVPANAILHRYFSQRPSLWIGGLTIVWGLVMTCHGFVKNFSQLMVVRVLLGVTEAGFFPGAVLICSTWYPRHMLQVRIAIFYTASALAGAFSGLLAFALAKMDGLGGYKGWSWIFIIEGLATTLLGLAVPFVLIDTAAGSKWLSDDEKKYIKIVMREQDAEASKGEHEGVNWKVIKSVITDWQLLVHTIIYWSNTVPNYSMKFSMPAIMTAMGYKKEAAQLMTIPPYTIGAVAACFAALYSDKMKRRWPFIAAAQTLVCIAFAILLPLGYTVKTQKSSQAGSYFAICLACLGYPISPGVNSWVANNLAGPARRSVGIAFVIAMGNIGGIIGSYIYMDKEKPRYTTGFAGSLAFAAAGLIAGCCLEIALIRINKKRDAMSREDVLAKYTEEELAAMGDRSPLFRYTL